MKTIHKVLIGLSALTVGFVVYKKTRPVLLTPYEKMLKDVLDPSTQISMAQRSYLKSVNQPETYDNLKSAADYRVNHPEDPIAIAYNAKSQWAPDEIVTW